MEKNRQVPEGRQTFSEIIEENMIYVDKTALLAEMIDGPNYAWFLARPRHFGKSLTVSTFKSIFSGQKELFKGLAIEKRLDEKNFAPRPVIHLDLSLVASNGSVDEFKNSLDLHTMTIAKILKVDLEPAGSGGDLLRRLIMRTFRKYNSEVAILVDEYDAPVTCLYERPDEMNVVRDILSEYYTMFKSLEEYISFVFMTGVTKSVKAGQYSGFNNYTDISQDPKYGEITGFTQEEIQKYFGEQIEEVAKYQKISKNKLLEKMKEYYNGFCFDGKTHVYNPFSTLQFFKNKEFYNFWFDTEDPNELTAFIKRKKITLEKYSGSNITLFWIENPGSSRDQDPPVYLFQLGYLSLKSTTPNVYFIFDYPNIEVRNSMARHIMDAFLDNRLKATKILKLIDRTLLERDPDAFVTVINKFFSLIPLDYFIDEPQDSFLKLALFSLCVGSRFEVCVEPHHDGSHLVINNGDVTWVIVTKITSSDKDDEPLANVAIDQITEKNYSAKYNKPVLLGIVINSSKSRISAWKVGG